MTPEDIRNILGSDFEAVKDLVRSRLSSSVPLLQEVNGSLLEHSGKMMRPSLCLLMARACGGSNDDTIRYAAAVELLHNSTLLHDDVADDSDLRRGVPTVKSRLGAVPAVLVGDFWLARSIDVILGSGHHGWAVPAFSKTLGDLAEGEMLQQQKAFSCDTSEEDYKQIIYCKTASLFELSCSCAAVSVDASKEFFDAAKAYGKALGMAFQIKDDILDYTGVDLGKPCGRDLAERKITLPLLGALKDSGCEPEIRGMVRSLPEHPENCEKLAAFVSDRGGIAYAQQQLHSFICEAISALAPLPASREKEMLEEFARLNEIREK
ncbi:MAG: polyprenyl synthetase family protein [Bacteroidales bacterium]|nr:polyprenyl synthetase family protein [Bacteroidales bacterium]